MKKFTIIQITKTKGQAKRTTATDYKTLKKATIAFKAQKEKLLEALTKETKVIYIKIDKHNEIVALNKNRVIKLKLERVEA